MFCSSASDQQKMPADHAVRRSDARLANHDCHGFDAGGPRCETADAMPDRVVAGRVSLARHGSSETPSLVTTSTRLRKTA